MTQSSSASAPVPRFRAGRLPIKIVGLTIFAAACAVAAAWGGIDVGQTWGIEPVDGGVLKPLWQRLAFGGSVASLGIAFLVGMLVYWRYYIVSLDVVDEGRTVEIRRIFPLPVLRLPVADVSVGTRVHGAYRGVPLNAHARMESVDAPYLTVRLRGWRLPLVLDLQGKFPDGAPRGTDAADSQRH